MITLKKNSLRYKDKDGNMQDSGVLFGHNETDITLTKSGIAADAKATGDELERLSEEKVDKAYIVSVFRELKQVLQGGDIDSAIAILDEAILDLSELA